MIIGGGGGGGELKSSNETHWENAGVSQVKLMRKYRVVDATVHERILVKEEKKLSNNCACVRLVTQYQLLNISYSVSNS